MSIQTGSLGLTVHHTGHGASQVGSLAMTVHHQTKGSVRAGSLGMVIHHNDSHKPVLMGSLAIAVHHTGQRTPVPVAGLTMLVHRSLGLYINPLPLAVEPEIPLGGIRVKIFGGPYMRQAYFNVLLSHAPIVPVSVNWNTIPGSAVPPAEFTMSSGTLVFEAGQTSKIIVIPVREYDADVVTTFDVLLSAPINASIVDATGVATL